MTVTTVNQMRKRRGQLENYVLAETNVAAENKRLVQLVVISLLKDQINVLPPLLDTFKTKKANKHRNYVRQVKPVVELESLSGANFSTNAQKEVISVAKGFMLLLIVLNVHRGNIATVQAKLITPIYVQKDTDVPVVIQVEQWSSAMTVFIVTKVLMHK